MTVTEFMSKNISEIEQIISELDTTFNSHTFIKRFSKRFERDYINFLSEHNGNEAFRHVHSQIARYLSENSTVLQIQKQQRVKSENIFGEIDEIQEWQKV